MDKWNLHTFTEHGVSSDKIAICYVKNSYKMSDILAYALTNTSLDIKVICPVLYGYLKSRKRI